MRPNRDTARRGNTCKDSAKRHTNGTRNRPEGVTVSEPKGPAERGGEPDWQEIAKDFEGQVSYLLRRCLAAEDNDGDPVAMEALIADMEDVSRL